MRNIWFMFNCYGSEDEYFIIIYIVWNVCNGKNYIIVKYIRWVIFMYKDDIFKFVDLLII